MLHELKDMPLRVVTQSNVVTEGNCQETSQSDNFCHVDTVSRSESDEGMQLRAPEHAAGEVLSTTIQNSLTSLRNADYWRQEHHYIEDVATFRKLDSFNNDPLCFIRYCEMQAATARKDSFHQRGDAIQGIADDFLLAELAR